MTGDRRDLPVEVTEDGSDEPFAPADAGAGSGRADGASPYVYDLDDQPPSLGVPMAVAAVTGRPATALEPLYEAIDSDALDVLVGRETAAADARSFSVTFTYAGTTVTVDSTRRVLVHR